MTRSRRSVLFVVALIGLSLLSCGREVTGPENGLSFGRGRVAALALDPQFPRVPGANAISDLVPFERVRITLRRVDGSIAKDTMVEFPSTADSVTLSIVVPLPITAPDSGLTLGLSLAYVNASGDTVFRGGPLPITARARSSTTRQPIEIQVSWVPPGGVVPASVVLTPENGTAVAGTTSTFTAVARDAQGQPIAGTPIFFSSEDTLRARVASVGSGVVTWQPLRGTARIIATLPNGPADTSAFDVSLPASRLLLVAGDAQTATIGTPLGQPLAFRVTASDSVPVAGMPVTFTVTTGGGTLSALADTSDAAGLVATSWTLGALVGTQTVTATVTGVPAATRVVSAAGLAPVPTQLAITAAPTAAVAGANLSPVTVEVRDAGGALTPLFTGPVSIGLDPATAGGATLGGTTTVNAVTGVATFADLNVTRASAGLSLIATSAGLAPDTSAALTVAAAAATQITSTSGVGQVAAVLTTLAAPFVVRVTDAFGNPVAGTTVNWAVTGGTGSLSTASTATNAAGEASTTLTLGGTIGAVTVGATATGLAGSPVLFTATATAGAPALLFFSQNVTSAAAASVNEWVVQVRDAAGNVSTGFNGPVSVALIDGPPTALLGGTTTVNAVAGFATFNTLTVDLAATTYRLVASSAGLPDAQSAVFTITPAAPATLALVSGDGQTGVISAALAQPFVTRVTDAFTNPVPGVTVNWAIATGGGALSAPSAVTDALGNASVSLTTGPTAGTSTVTATAAGLAGSPLTFTTTVTADAAAQLVITSAPLGTLTAGVLAPDLVVEARDAAGNLATSFAGTVWGRVNTGPVIGNDSVPVAAVGGIATFTTVGFDRAGSYTLRFNAAGLADAISPSFDVVAGPPEFVSPDTLASGDGQTGTVGQLLALPLRAIVQDTFSNPVAGVPVTFTGVRGADTLSVNTVASDALGIASFTPTLPLTPGVVTYRVTSPGLTGSGFVYFATAEAGAATRLVITQQPGNTTSNSPIPTTVVVAQDAQGNTAASFVGAIEVVVDSGPVLGWSMGGTQTVNATAGEASFTDITLDRASQYRLRFRSVGLDSAASLPFLVGPGAAASLTVVEGDAQTAAASQALADSLGARLTDAFGNTITGATVTWSITTGGGSISPAASVTDAAGIARAAWTLGTAVGAQGARGANGALQADFTATATSGGAGFTWTGAESTDWFTAGNWVQNAVPAATDSVTIPASGVTNMPLLLAPAVVRALVNDNALPITVDAGSTLSISSRAVLRNDVGGIACLSGAVDVGGGEPAATMRGRFDCAVNAAATVTALDGPTTIVGAANTFTVTSGADFAVNGQRMVVAGLFTTQGTGRLLMNNAQDSLDVGTADFSGGATTGALVAGDLVVRGDLLTGVSPNSFDASAAHGTRLLPGVGDTATVNAGTGLVGFGQLLVDRPTRLTGASRVFGDLLVSYSGAIVGTGSLAVVGTFTGTTGTLVAPRLVEIGGVLADTGTFRPDTTVFSGAGQVMPFRVGVAAVPQYQTVIVTGTVQSGHTGGINTIAGDLIIDGGTLLVDDVTQSADIWIGRDLRVVGNGRLVSTGRPHSIQVGRHATFDGGASSGDLANGALRVRGDFTQLATQTVGSFQPASTYVVYLDSIGTVSFASPSDSRFTGLIIDQTGAERTLLTDVDVFGILRLRADGGATLRSDVLGSGGTRRITALGIEQLGTMQFRNVTLRLEGALAVNFTSTLTFSDFDPAVVQFDIARDNGTVDIYDPVFSTTPSSGLYLRVEDSDPGDGQNLVVNVNGAATPAFHSGFATAIAPAVLTGWGTNPGFTWTGNGSTSDWNTTANWSSGVIPAASDSVFVPGALLYNPIIPAGTSLRAFVSARTESPITTAGTFTITGTLSVPTLGGLDCGANSLEFSNGATSMSARGLVSCYTRLLDGTVATGDTLLIAGNDLQVEGSAILEANPGLLSVGGQFGLIGATSLLRMLDDSAHVVLLGGATFSGASTAGQLTAGLLEIHGNFTQSGDPESFAASGTHVTEFAGNVPQQVAFGNPGPAAGSSHFAHLAPGQTEAGVSVRLNSNVYATGQLRAGTGAVRTFTAGGAVTLTSGGANLSGATFDGVPWVLADGATVGTVTGIAFTAMPPDVAQFSVVRASGVVAAANFTFGTTPTTGVYVRAEDPDGAANGSLVVSMSGTSPAGHGGAIAEVNTATIVGWSATPQMAWTGGGGNSLWSNPANWSLGRIPVAADSVLIDQTATIDLNESAQVAWLMMGLTSAPTLNLNSGATLRVDSAAAAFPGATLNMATGSTLTGEGAISLGGVFNWNGGTMSGIGGTLIAAGGTAAIATSAGVTIDDRILAVAGTASIGAGAIATSGDPAISIIAGGTLDFVATNSLFAGAGTMDIVNSGLLRKAASAGTVRIDWPITNVGTIEIEDETLDLRSTFSQAVGTISIASGATLVNGGQFLATTGAITIADGAALILQSGGVTANNGFHRLDAGTSVTGAGTLRFFNADTVIVTGAVDVDSLVVGNSVALFESADTIRVANGGYIGGGFFSGSSTIAISGLFSVAPGNPNGTGTIFIRPGAELQTAGAVFRGWDIDVAGTWNWGDGDLGLTNDPLNVADFAVVNIRPGGLLSMNHAATARSLFGYSGVGIINNGILRKASGGATTQTFGGLQVANFGTIDVVSGAFTIQSGCSVAGTITGSGTFTGAGCGP